MNILVTMTCACLTGFKIGFDAFFTDLNGRQQEELTEVGT